LRAYNRDQFEAILAVHRYLERLPASAGSDLRRRIAPYLRFREEVAAFQRSYLSELCTAKCFVRRTSACCNREGIAIFFADVVVNTLLSSPAQIEALLSRLTEDRGGPKCVYLTETGCLWRLKPVVCEMFLCDHARQSLMQEDGSLLKAWDGLRAAERRFTWPDRPVLFDLLETVFLKAGHRSPLMYCHRSPGLLRVKAQSSRRPAQRDEG
jgi:hypothetical protein